MNQSNPKKPFGNSNTEARGDHKPGGQPGQEPEPTPQGPPNKPGQYNEANRDQTGSDQDDEHEGATEKQIGDRTGPGVGYDEGAAPKKKQQPGVA